jgi:hypothetical protein
VNPHTGEAGFLRSGRYIRDCGEDKVTTEQSLLQTSVRTLISDGSLSVLNDMSLDAGSRGRFEWLSGGLMWPDEFPPLGTPERKLISTPQEAIGCLLACRAFRLPRTFEN